MSEACIFCRIASGSLPAKFVHRDEDVVAFDDLNPRAPTHVLLIPREHIARAVDLKPEHEAVLGRLFQVATQIARDKNLEDGFRLVVNNGAAAGQSVFHLHLHLLGGRPLEWPPG